MTEYSKMPKNFFFLNEGNEKKDEIQNNNKDSTRKETDYQKIPIIKNEKEKVHNQNNNQVNNNKSNSKQIVHAYSFLPESKK